MTTYYPRQSSGLGAVIVTLIIAAVLVFAVLWYIGRQHDRTAGQELSHVMATAPAETHATSTSTSATLSSTGADLDKAGSTASSALSKAGVAASQAVSETSADIKAAVDKQKQQEAAERRHDHTS